jgi:2-C-methyl-D-erythritol 4-phosphate cytidylyltransferase
MHHAAIIKLHAGENAMDNVGAVVVAAGRGTRMGAADRKTFLPLAGKPVVVHALEALEAAGVAEIVLVAAAEDAERAEALCREYGLSAVRRVVPGGAERPHSVREGLLALGAEWAIVHDGARPLVAPGVIRRCVEAARRAGGAVAAVPVKDTIKLADAAGMVEATPDRSRLWAVQTPQVFRRADLLRAIDAALADGFVATDDASAAERLGIPVQLVMGDYRNIKITTPEDLELAELWLGGRTASGR